MNVRLPVLVNEQVVGYLIATAEASLVLSYLAGLEGSIRYMEFVLPRGIARILDASSSMPRVICWTQSRCLRPGFRRPSTASLGSGGGG